MKILSIKIKSANRWLITVVLFMLVGYVGAQVSTLTNWTLHTHTTSTAATTTSFSIPTGTNSYRMLVVAIASSTSGVGTRNATVTYGGQTLTLANGDFSMATTRQHTAIYYLKESGIDAATNTTLSVTLGNGTTRINDVWYSIYDYVDQNSPVYDTQNYNSVTTPVDPFQYSTALNVNSNNLALEIISTIRSGNTSPRTMTAPTNWTLNNQQTWTTVDGVRNAIATRSIPTTSTTDVSSVNMSGNVLASMTSISLNSVPKYYRSAVATGSWNTLSSWEQSFDGVSGWVVATSLPSGSDAQVHIRSGHTITLGSVTQSTDLLIDGNLIINSTNTLTPNSAIINGNVTVSGTGSLIKGSGIINFNSGSTYTHNRDGGSIPICTWNSNSTCLINGVTATVPTASTFIQTFGNFDWNCASQTANISLQGAITSITGNLTIQNTNTGSLRLFNGGGNYALTVDGNFTQNAGQFYVFGTGTGTGFTGILNVNGNFTMAGGTFDLSGSSGTGIVNVAQNFNFSSGTITESGTGIANFNFNGSTTQVYSKSGGSFTNTIDFGINTTSTVDFGTSIIDGSTGTFNLLGSGTIITANTGGLSLTGATGSIQVTGTRSYSATANYVYNAAAPQVTGLALVTANNVTINNISGVSLSTTTTINNLLTLENGRLLIGTSNLIFGTAALPVYGTLNASNMIVAASTGQVRKLLSTAGSYLFPIGETVSVAEYSPITINFTSGTFAGGAYVAASVTNAKHPNNAYTKYYLNRYFTVSSSGITAFVADIDAKFLDADTVGVASNQITARYASGVWTNFSVLSNNSMIATGLTSFGDFTGISNIPEISTSISSLTGFTYQQGAGPSAIQNFTVTGSKLTDNVIVNPSTSFEVSELSGVNFVARSFVTLYASGGSVSQIVYVRMKAGISQGTVSAENLVVSTNGALSSLNVACSGSVTAAPTITVATSPVTNPVSLSGFSATFKGTASAIQSFTVSGANLLSSVTLEAPNGYEIKTSAQSTYVTSLVLTPAGATLASTTINVRLKSGLGVGSYNGNLVASASYADNKTVTLSGVVNPVATLTTSTSWLAGFTYSGTGPSSSQTFQLIGTNLSANVTVTPPTNFELSVNGTTWNTTAFTVTQTGGNVNQTIYARLRSGRTANTAYGPENVSLSSTGAVVKTVALSGFVANSATILVSKNSLNGFGYLFGAGPSVSQSLTVSGALLSQDITVTPPSNFEIYNTATGLYQTGAITLARTGTTVNATQVTLRLASGLTAQDYAGNLAVSSTGATTKTVAITGKVFASPLISSTGGGNYCVGDNINLTSTGTDVVSQYWTGPNSFYSIIPNPTLTSATTAMSGSYTVTGNVIVGGNLIVNGDFEMDNAGFSSSYGYVAPTASALQPEGLYTVTTLPSTVHTNFNNTPDKNVVGTKQMVINGNTTAGAVVWTQSVPVVPESQYEFTYWLQTVVNGTDPAPSKLQLYVNGVMAGPVYTANATSGIWTQYIYNTLSGTNTILNLELINQTTAANGNDFALDSITFKQILSATSTESVVVSPSLTASVTVTHSPSTIYQNTPVVFTANPVNGGTPAYKWFINGVEQVGQTASTLNYTPTSTGAVNVSCQMTSSIACALPKPAIGSDAITVQAPIQNYWMGYIDTDWGKAGNWTANYIPATGDNVIYATVANFGTAAMNDLQLDRNRTIGSLINATVKRLIIPANLTLICNSVIDVTPPVTNPVTLPEDLVVIKASLLLPNGSIIYRNPQNMPAYGTVEMYSPASWDKTRPINQKYNWQFFGIPVSSVNALPTFYGVYVRELLESDNDTATHWRMLTNESVLIPFKGYELCQQYANTLYVFKGQLVNSNFNSGQFVKTTGALYPGQHLFANPYTSAIDINLMDFGTGVENTVYLYATGSFVQWRTNKLLTQGAIPGQYFSVPKGQAGTYGIPRQIPSMGTMMVRVPAANASTANSYVNFVYNTVAMGNSERQRVKASNLTDNQTVTVVNVEGENSADKMWLMSNESFSRNFDNGFDGLKMTGNALNPQIYAVEADGKYQVNSVDDINNTTLAFQAGQDNEYKITFTHNENTQLKYNKIYLHDFVENKIIDISMSGTSYNFTAVSTVEPVIRFKILAQNSTNESTTKNNIKVYHNQDQLYVQNFSQLQGKLYVYDITGRTIGIKSISANGNVQITAPKNNTYIVKVVVGDQTETAKIFIH